MAKKSKKTKQNKLSPKKYIVNKVRNLPIGKCYINDNWEEEGLASIFVIREHKGGNITVGYYLVDLLCKGVKDTGFKFNISTIDFEEGSGINENEGIVECEYKLVHNIIYESISYADDLEFFPHKDFEITEYILEEDDGSVGDIQIKTGGENGKPLLIEFNPVQFNKDYNHLLEVVGEGNFDFIGDSDDDFIDDYDDDDYDDDDYYDEDLGEADIEEKMYDLFTELFYAEIYEKINNKKYTLQILPINEDLELCEYSNEYLNEIIDDIEDGNNTKDIVLEFLKTENAKVCDLAEIIEGYVIYEKYEEIEFFSNKLMEKFPESIIPKYYLILYYLHENNNLKAFYLYDSFKEDLERITIFQDYFFYNNASALINIAKNNIKLADSFIALNKLLIIKYNYLGTSINYIEQKLLIYKKNYMEEKIDEISEKDFAVIEQNVKIKLNKFLNESIELLKDNK